MKRYSDLRVFATRHPILSVLLVIALLAAIIVPIWRFWPRTVYVTDGGHVFNENLRHVEGLIKHENDWVTGSGLPYVTVAVLATMSPQPNVEPLDDNRIRYAIEGAYLAQYESNHANGPNGRPVVPLTRLVLADEGSRENSWSQAASALEADIGNQNRLVAVTGLGISVPNTRRVIDKLGADHMAMVASVLTGDEFNRIPGMVRVAPTDTDEAAALVGFLDNARDPLHPLPADPRIWVVQDQNPDDAYSLSLLTDFIRQITTDTHRRYQVAQPGTSFNSSLPDAATVLSGTGQGVCDTDADVVYFAGRGVDLQGLLTGLAHRSCKIDRHLTVVTGSDAGALSGHTGLWDSSDNMDVYYAGLAHDAMWPARPDLANSATTSWFTSRPYGFRSMFPSEYSPNTAPDPLAGGWAIMFHDGVLTATTAVDNLYKLNDTLPEPGAVAQELNQVTVPGASGYLCFDADHNAVGKPVPIVRLTQDGQLAYIGVFSATGGAPLNRCG